MSKKESSFENPIWSKYFSALFDDFASLVSEGNESSFNAIHLFWLSGFYIPLSFFLEVCADAIKLGWEKTDDYF